MTKGLTPMAVAHGLEPLELSKTLKVEFLATSTLVEAALSSLMASIDNDPDNYLCVSLDAEWNITRTVGVSIIQLAPHSEPDSVLIIPVGCSQNSTNFYLTDVYRFTNFITNCLHLFFDFS
jgi:hypothetical protein